MKNLTTLILASFFFSITLTAQQNNLVTFEYDAAGNRVKRHANKFCEQEKFHNEPFTINHNLYKAEDNIESSIFVEASDSIIYQAGEFILLDNGFEVFSEAEFLAEIEICETDSE